MGDSLRLNAFDGGLDVPKIGWVQPERQREPKATSPSTAYHLSQLACVLNGVDNGDMPHSREGHADREFGCTNDYVGTTLSHGVEHLGTVFRPNIPPLIEDSKCGPHGCTALFEREDLGRSGRRSLGVTPPNNNIIGFVRTIPRLAQRSQEVVGALAPGTAATLLSTIWMSRGNSGIKSISVLRGT
jgi:hypothetical protein